MLDCASNDVFIMAHCPRRGVGVLFADVAETLGVLSGRQDLGPTAETWLAGALLGATLLGGLLRQPRETLRLDLFCTGPLETLRVELADGGLLCGAPGVRHLGALDEAALEPAFGDVLGGRVRAEFRCGEAGARPRWEQDLERPSEPFAATLKACFEAVTQRPTVVELVSAADDGVVTFAQGLLAQSLPGGDPRAFEHIRGVFDEGAVGGLLSADATLDAWRVLLQLPDLTVERTMRLGFGCRCSKEQAAAGLSTLAPDDLRSLARSGVPPCVRCPLCGEEYGFTAREIEALMEPRGGEEGTEEQS